jgi:hypothetical protein
MKRARLKYAINQAKIGAYLRKNVFGAAFLTRFFPARHCSPDMLKADIERDTAVPRLG